MSKRVCVMDGCANVQHGKGVCRPHYMKCWRGQLDWPEYTRPPEPTAEQRFWQKVLMARSDAPRRNSGVV